MYFIQQTNNAAQVNSSPLPANLLLTPSISQVPAEKVFEVITAAIATVYADTNFRLPGDDDFSYLVNTLLRNILKRFPQLRLAEIPGIFSSGARGKYGEYFGLSVISFEGFIEHYLVSEERKALIIEKNRMLSASPESSVPTADEQFDISKNLLIETFEKENTPWFSTAALTAYGFLDKIGLVTFTASEKWEFLQKAIPVTLEDLRREALKVMADQIRRRQIMTEINAFKTCQDEGIDFSPAHSQLIRCAAKRLALKSLFQQYRDGSINLFELLDSKREVYLSLQTQK